MHDLDARIADQHIDAAIGRDHLCHSRIDLFFTLHIHHHRHGRAAGKNDLIGSGLRSRLVHVGNDHLAALTRKGQGDFLADAAGGAGDDADFVLEFHGDAFG